MNFPDVPFDENLFASNSMLKSYWERSTNERSGAIIPDWPTEDYSDLRNETLNHFNDNSASDVIVKSDVDQKAAEAAEAADAEAAEAEAAMADSVEPVVEVLNVPEPVKDAIVKPKSLSTSEVLGIVFASLAVAVVIIYFFLVRFKGSRRY